MRRIRLFALAIASFVVALIAAVVSPGTWLNRAIAMLTCSIFSFNSTVCSVNWAKMSDRSVAANPPILSQPIPEIDDVLLSQRSREFDDEPTNSPPTNNPSIPAYPQQVSPSTPVRPEFDNGIQDATRDAVSDIVSNGKCDYPRMFYVTYINGIQTKLDGELNKEGIQEIGYTETIDLVNSILADAKIPNPSVRKITYNYGGSFVGDITESTPQSLLGITLTGDGQKLISDVTSQIKKAEDNYKKLNDKSDCSCKIPKPEYLIIAESQGNFFAQEIVNKLFDDKNSKDLTQRMGILSISSFTDYGKARNRVKAFQYMLRPDEIAAVVNGKLAVKNPGSPNLSPFPTLVSQATQNSNKVLPLLLQVFGFKVGGLIGLASNELGDALKKAGVPWQQAWDSHLVSNYLGRLQTPHIQIPSKDIAVFEKVVNDSRNRAVANVRNIFATIEDSYYEKEGENCSHSVSQSEQITQSPVKPPSDMHCSYLAGLEALNSEVAAKDPTYGYGCITTSEKSCTLTNKEAITLLAAEHAGMEIGKPNSRHTSGGLRFDGLVCITTPQPWNQHLLTQVNPNIRPCYGQRPLQDERPCEGRFCDSNTCWRALH